jgi:carboxyl-terminal processing protease
MYNPREMIELSPNRTTRRSSRIASLLRHWITLPITLMIVGFAGAVLASTTLQAPTAVTQDKREIYRQTFDIVWRTVKDKHFDPGFGGVDWDQIRVKYAPQVDQVTSELQLYRLLQKMLGELKQSHFSILPTEAAGTEGQSSVQSIEGQIGVQLRFINGQAVITKIEADSTGSRAGLKPGFIVKGVNGIEVAALVKPLEASDIPNSYRTLLKARAIENRLSGSEGSKVRVRFLNEKGLPRETEVTRERVKGEYSPPFGNMPPQRTEFETRTLAGGIVYLRFNVWVISLMPRIREAIRSFNSAPGLIIDLRDNPGGLGGMAPGIAGLLSDKTGSLGRMQMRTGYMDMAIFPQPQPFPGPIAILINDSSASTSEVFASGMQELGRAMVVGERSVGAALPSLFTRLPTGAIFQYAIADFKSPRGNLIEGSGVIPDVEVKLDRASLLSGRDIQLEAAMKAVRGRNERKVL